MPRKLRKSFVELPNAILFLRISRERVFRQPRLWVLKKEQRESVLLRLQVLHWDGFSFAVGLQLSGRGQDRAWPLAEEADQSLDVLGGRCQEELLTNKLQSP